MSLGYSGTPLVRKLGIKENFKVWLVNEPQYYLELLGELPDGVQLLNDPADLVDFIHLFAPDLKTLETSLPKLKDRIKKNGMIWVSWYKKASKIPTDVTEDEIRATCLPLGLVDVKVCAVDEKWSGLKLVWRKELR